MSIKRVFSWINVFLNMIGAMSVVFALVVMTSTADYLEAGTVALIAGIMVGMCEVIRQEA